MFELKIFLGLNRLEKDRRIKRYSYTCLFWDRCRYSVGCN